MVASSLRELVIHGMHPETRRHPKFAPLCVQTLKPKEFKDDAPPNVMADWLEDRGDATAAAVLRSLQPA